MNDANESLTRRLYGIIVEHHILLERTVMPDGSVHVAKCPICGDPESLKTFEETAEVLNREIRINSAAKDGQEPL